MRANGRTPSSFALWVPPIGRPKRHGTDRRQRVECARSGQTGCGRGFWAAGSTGDAFERILIPILRLLLLLPMPILIRIVIMILIVVTDPGLAESDVYKLIAHPGE